MDGVIDTRMDGRRDSGMLCRDRDSTASRSGRDMREAIAMSLTGAWLWLLAPREFPG